MLRVQSPNLEGCLMSKAENTAIRNVLFRYIMGGLFTTVEVLAAMQLDGWLSVALWVVAAWNVFSLAILTVGLAALAARAPKGGA